MAELRKKNNDELGNYRCSVDCPVNGSACTEDSAREVEDEWLDQFMH